MPPSKPLAASPGPAYVSRMARTTSKSWLPKRSGATGRFLTAKGTADSPRTSAVEKNAQGDGQKTAAHYRSSVSGRIDLPNGQFITTVRKDVMDRALGRGDFKKK